MELVSQKKELLGSLIEIQLPNEHSFLFSPCFEEIARIEKTYSRFIDNSELSTLNKTPHEWKKTTEEMLKLIQKAEEFYTKTNGFFDITVKSALDALGYDSKYSFTAKQGTEQRNTKRPQIHFDTHTALLNNEIDFGGLGKGYALDRVAQLLESHGVNQYYINAGGDIYAKASGSNPWTILLEHPDDATRAIGSIELNGKAIAASAPNRRKWGEYHHLIDPKTMLPAQGVKAIFIIAQTGIEADAYAKGIFCAGFEKGIAISQKLPVEMLLISAENKMYQSKGFDATFF